MPESFVGDDLTAQVVVSRPKYKLSGAISIYVSRHLKQQALFTKQAVVCKNSLWWQLGVKGAQDQPIIV